MSSFSKNLYMKIFLLVAMVFLGMISGSIKAQGYNVKTIVIDAGHGGKDPGAVGRVGKEKDINLTVSLLVGTYIEKNLPDVKVIYTRKTDVFVELYKRADIANKNKADLFVSIHVNAVPNPKINGASTWLLGVSKNQSNLDMAKKENSVIEIEDNYEEKYQGFDPNKDESYIIFSFNSTKAFFEQSLSLAQELQNQFSNRVGRRNYGIQQAEFLVLHRTTMPSVLIELGFITNPDEEKFLMSQQGQEYLASAIFRAIREYKNQVEAKNHKAIVVDEPTPKPQINSQTNIIIPEPVSQNKPVENKPAPSVSAPAVATPVAGITFRVQFLLSPKEIALNDTRFKNIEQLWMYKDGNYYKYTAGNSSNFDEIMAIRKKMLTKYPDAFIVAFKDDKRISVNEARKLLETK
jgi:N-acetylmuramoyl-L-alanine amidase